jgi:hypothetical protein
MSAIPTGGQTSISLPPDNGPYSQGGSTLDGNDAVPSAQISIGELSYDSVDSAYIDDGETDIAIFTDYEICNYYENDQHVYMMPVASPGGLPYSPVDTGGTIPNGPNAIITSQTGSTAAFVQLAMPTLLWICDWTACRSQEQPDIPSPAPTEQGWVLLDQHVEPVMLVLGADGVTPLYRISGTYVYGKINPSSDALDDARYPRPPWMVDLFSRTQPSDNIQTGLTDGVGGGNFGLGFPDQ